MLVRITNKCQMMCSHCFTNATPDSTDMMGMTLFVKIIKFILENDAPLLLISGGEPFENPLIFQMVDIAKGSGLECIILSNGMFTENDEMLEKVLAMNIPIQITNDKRYYPKKVKYVKHNLLTYNDIIPNITPLGRAIESNIAYSSHSPLCFNIRSLTHATKDYISAISLLRYRCQKYCTPSINIDGTISVGETSNCAIIGDIDSTSKELTKNIINMKCNKCGMEKNLGPEHRRAIKI